MKKLACMLLALAMMLSLAACGGNSGNNAANNGGTDNQTNNQTNNQQGEDTDTGSGEPPKVALMSMRQMTQPADLNTLEGVDRLKEEMGLDVNIVVCTEVSEYYDQMQALCEEEMCIRDRCAGGKVYHAERGGQAHCKDNEARRQLYTPFVEP